MGFQQQINTAISSGVHLATSLSARKTAEESKQIRMINKEITNIKKESLQERLEYYKQRKINQENKAMISGLKLSEMQNSVEEQKAKINQKEEKPKSEIRKTAEEVLSEVMDKTKIGHKAIYRKHYLKTGKGAMYYGK